MRLDICIDVAHALTYLHMYAGELNIFMHVHLFKFLKYGELVFHNSALTKHSS